ncbi:MAG: hypothetical protein JWO13_3241 [Acidobacteriales bacterium]|nr:hypothetical protein [Terriglobales bacterium]
MRVMRYHRKMRVRAFFLTISAICAVLLSLNAQEKVQAGDYPATILKWREERQAKLRADDGWLTVSGLFWLKEGDNTFGSAPMNDIVLPKDSPAKAGSFALKQGHVFLQVSSAVKMLMNGKPAQNGELHPDSDKLQSGDLTMFVINRGDKFGIRLRDKNSRMRKEFSGLTYYKIDPKLRIVADFIPYDPPKKIKIPTLLGTSVDQPSPGRAEFVIAGKKFTLEPTVEDADTLFFVFKDTTSGSETYGAGRFLYTLNAKDGKLVLDFNKAENPPCAFTPYATCPLPPPENRLSIPIRAGEMKYGKH